ncbi:TolC family protein [Puteibacter caeruleilacunae]|nr:TolC family protein [Puteibacter caeruleilacunae]
MIKLKIYLIAVLMVLLSSFAKAQKSLSLEQAIVNTLEQNYSILLKRKEVDITTTNNSWGAAGRYPSVDFSSSFNLEKNNNSNDDWDQNNLNVGVELDWVLFDGFRVNITKTQLNELQELSEGRLQVLVESTVKDIMLSYYFAQLQAQKLQVADFILKQSKERLVLEEGKNKIGLEGTYALLQAKNAFLEDLRYYKLQELNYNNAIRQLNLIMAERIDSKYVLSDSIPADLGSYAFDDLKHKTLSSNSSLQNQYINIKLAQQQVELTKSNYYPTLSLNTGISVTNRNTDYSQKSTSHYNSEAAFVGVSLKYRLFSGGKKARARQIAGINKEIAVLEKDDMESVLLAELHSDFERFNVMQDLFEYAEENLKAAELNLKMSTDKYEAGVINSFNYRDVQILYRNSALDKLQATYDLAASKVDLLLTSGGILKK